MRQILIKTERLRRSSFIISLCLFAMASQSRAEGERHSGESGQKSRAISDVITPQVIEDILSACDPGRGGDGIQEQDGVFSDDFSPGINSANREEETSGSGVLQATCFKCHFDFPAQVGTESRVQKWIGFIESGDMPKPSHPFLGNEKEVLLNYLRQRD